MCAMGVERQTPLWMLDTPSIILSMLCADLHYKVMSSTLVTAVGARARVQFGSRV